MRRKTDCLLVLLLCAQVNAARDKQDLQDVMQSHAVNPVHRSRLNAPALASEANDDQACE